MVTFDPAWAQRYTDRLGLELEVRELCGIDSADLVWRSTAELYGMRDWARRQMAIERAEFVELIGGPLGDPAL